MKFNWTNAIITWAASTVICLLLGSMGVSPLPAAAIDLVILLLIVNPVFPPFEANKEE